jgi:hypothetical protein
VDKTEKSQTELFDADGCLTDEGLRALTNGALDELGRLEAAEHLAYCDRCLARYTALPELQEALQDPLQAPPRDLTGPVMRGIWARLVQNVYGRVAVAGVAAALALGLWQVGAFDLIFTGSKYLANYTEKTTAAAAQQDDAWEAPTDALVQQSLGRLVDAWGSLLEAQTPQREPAFAADDASNEHDQSEETEL